MAPFAKVFAVQIESLNPPVLAVGYVNRPVMDHNPMYQMELARTRAGRTPLANTVPLRIVLEDSSVAVAVGDEQFAMRAKSYIRSTA